MRDCRKQLVTALITAINGLGTGLQTYTKLPKGDLNNVISYPYCYLTEINDTEAGSKAEFVYDVNVSIELVFANLDDKAEMWDTANEIKTLFCGDAPFLLTDNFTIQETKLTSTTEAEDLMGSQDVDTITIIINFTIEDNN